MQQQWNNSNKARLLRLDLGLRAEAVRCRHRRTLVLAGTPEWARDGADILLEGSGTGSPVWLGNSGQDRQALPIDAGDKLLGRECSTLVYDAHCGFDPDSLGAAVGALRAGGLLLLLVPDLDDWPSLADPQAARIAIHPFAPEQVSGRFLWRLAAILRRAPGVIVIERDALLPAPAETSAPASEPSETETTPDQQRAVESIVQTARGRARRPLVLTSDRGRGKSAALGIAAARLLGSGFGDIIITAPRRASVEPVFQHAALSLPDAEVHRTRIDSNGRQLRFLAPDEVLRERPPADLLLVDEAAGIPAPLLEHLLRHYGRIIFATTVHGYEGTGRGFDLRFRASLDRWTPGWHTETLETPIRWAPGDPLEAMSFRALLLDAAPALMKGVVSTPAEQLRIELLDRDSLVRDEKTLTELFGLLVAAHYQTRPMDLRHLLDGPGVEVYVIRDQAHVIGTVLATREGGLAADLAEKVFAGHRRPRGHLLPQTLSAHAGLVDAPGLTFLRVIRIAVHPAARRRHIGRQLLAGVERYARSAGLDCLGASFGATADLLKFWQQGGFASVHLGSSRNATSGAHAVVVLRPLSGPGGELCNRAKGMLYQRLPVLLAGPLRGLEPEIVLHLLTRQPAPKGSIGHDERHEITAFAHASRSFEATLPPLHQLVLKRLGQAQCEGMLTEPQSHALIRLVLQHRTWADTAAALGLSGKRECIGVLREAAAILLRVADDPGPLSMT